MFGKHPNVNVMYFLFVVYCLSRIFSQIWSEGGDFPRVIEIALLFHLQLYKPGWQDWGQNGTDWSQMGQIRDFFRSEFSTFWLGEPTVLEIIRNTHKVKPFIY